MMNSSRQTAIVAGIAVMTVAVIGAGFIPLLFEMCNTGEISGPTFLGIAAVVATLFGVGLRLLLGPRKRRRGAPL